MKLWTWFLITEYSSNEHEIPMPCTGNIKALTFLKQLGYKQHIYHIKQENFLNKRSNFEAFAMEIATDYLQCHTSDESSATCIH